MRSIRESRDAGESLIILVQSSLQLVWRSEKIDGKATRKVLPPNPQAARRGLHECPSRPLTENWNSLDGECFLARLT
jgi:hypothetical protein